MGSLCKIACGVVGIGAFFLARSLPYDIEKEDVIKYIDNHEKERKEIFLHTRNYLEKTDSLFLDSLITEKQKRDYAKEYLRDPDSFLKLATEEIITEAKSLKDRVTNFYEEIKE